MSKSDSDIQRTTAFILPLIVYLVIVSFYPDFSTITAEDSADKVASFANRYLAMIGCQVILAVGLLIYFQKFYLEQFPLRCSLWSIPVGVIGVVLWIGICELHLEKSFFQMIGVDQLAATRPAINPFDHIQDRTRLVLFMILRFSLLAAIVPIIEELFLRGWLTRWIEDPAWESVSLQDLSWKALLVPSIYGVLTHPSEAIAAFLWFGLVTLLMKRTGGLWDCVIAHAVTNLLLGIYVIQFEQWHYW